MPKNQHIRMDPKPNKYFLRYFFKGLLSGALVAVVLFALVAWISPAAEASDSLESQPTVEGQVLSVEVTEEAEEEVAADTGTAEPCKCKPFFSNMKEMVNSFFVTTPDCEGEQGKWIWQKHEPEVSVEVTPVDSDPVGNDSGDGST